MRRFFLAFAVLVLAACSSKKSKVSMELIPVDKDGEEWGYVNHKGEFAIKAKYKEAYAFVDGVALVKNDDDKYGFINEDGEYVVKPVYINAHGFSEGLAVAVKPDGKIEYIDSKGKTAFTLPADIEQGGDFNDGLALILKNDLYGYIDTKGAIVIEPKFENATAFNEGLAIIGKMNKDKTVFEYGAINTDGEQVIEPKFENLSAFKEGMASFSKKGKYGFIDTKGEEVIDTNYDDVGTFSQGLAPVEKKGKWGYIDTKGEMVIKAKYKTALSFTEEGLAAVQPKDEGDWGYINKEGEMEIKSKFKFVSNFIDGIAFVYEDEEFGVIDKKGAFLIKPTFKTASFDKGGYYTISSDYFDPASIARTIFKGAESNSYKGISGNTSFEDVKKLYSNVSHENYGYFYPMDHSKTSRNIYLANASLGMADDFRVAAMRSSYEYDYTSGTYKEVQVPDPYNATYNDKAKVRGVNYNFELGEKAAKQSDEVLEHIRKNLPKGFKGTLEGKNRLLVSNGKYYLQMSVSGKTVEVTLLFNEGDRASLHFMNEQPADYGIDAAVAPAGMDTAAYNY